MGYVPSSEPDHPTCWQCGYDLRGLRVEDACPECGTLVWSREPTREAERVAQRASMVALVSLAAAWTPLAPVCVLGALLSLRVAARAEMVSRLAERAPPELTRSARACALVTFIVGGVMTCVWGGLLIAGVP